MARKNSKSPRTKTVIDGDRRKPSAKYSKPSRKKTMVAKARNAEISSSAEVIPPSALVLPESLDSSAAAGIRDILLAHRGSPLVVDAGQVRRTGMQAVQVLIAAARTWRADGHSYAVTNSTNEFLDTLALVGLPGEHVLVEGMIG